MTTTTRQMVVVSLAVLVMARTWTSSQAWVVVSPLSPSPRQCRPAIRTRLAAAPPPSLFRNTQQTPIGVDPRYYSFMEAPVLNQMSSNTANTAPPVTLTRYLDQAVKEHPEWRDLESLLLAVQMACKTISNLVNRAGLVWDHTAEHPTSDEKEYQDGRFYSMKRLDQLSTIVLKNALKFTGKCEVVGPVSASMDSESPAQHQPGVLIAKSLDSGSSSTTTTTSSSSGSYVACLDPLDGSGNADASICTGTIFGVFEQQQQDDEESDDDDDDADRARRRQERLVESVLQPAKNMRAAGYCLYSSATVLVFSLGESVQGFTLDPQINEFVLTHPNLTIPARGTVYSCNEGNSEDWDESSQSAWFHDYLRDIKTGRGETGQRYAHRYVGSMVGDIHRTLLYGGIFGYPANSATHPAGNLQLLYKTAPMAFVVSRAGGRAVDGTTPGSSLLNVQPARVHQKKPCFLGSPDDVTELERYLAKALLAEEANAADK